MYRQRPPRSPAQRFALAVAAVLAIVLGYYLGNQLGGPTVPRSPEHLVAAGEPREVSDLGLTDHFGLPFGSEQLTGRWSLFAFAHPADSEQVRASVTRLVMIHNRLVDWPDLQKQFRGVLVSLDPVADPRRLRELIGLDSPDFAGVSSDADAVAALAPPDTADPATSLALVGPDRRLRGWFTGELAPATIAADFKALARASAAD